MEVGVLQVMQSWGYEGMTDAEVYDQELQIALDAEAQGYDHVWVVEHHFEDYSFCPDPYVYLAHVAAKTERIGLATGATILPWNTQPLRVAEKAALLDHLSGGRFILGMGRGLSRREFDRFGIAMDESRERFDESAPMIVDALNTGVMKAHKGKFFDQPEAEIRPRPVRSFENRVTAVAMSPESIDAVAKLGVQMMAFNYRPPEVQKAEADQYKAAFRKHHGTDPRPMLLTEMTVVDTDYERAKANAEKYIPAYLLSVMHHYEMLSDHYADAKGYSSYGEAAKAMREMGMENVLKAYLDQQIWGTPDQILRRYEERRKTFGDFGTLLAFRFAGLPFEDVRRSQELFAKEVLPVLKEWKMEGEFKPAVAAE